MIELPPACIPQIEHGLRRCRAVGIELPLLVYLNAEAGPSVAVFQGLAEDVLPDDLADFTLTAGSKVFPLLCEHGGKGGKLLSLDLFSRRTDRPVWVLILNADGVDVLGINDGEIVKRLDFPYDPPADPHATARRRLQAKCLAVSLIASPPETA